MEILVKELKSHPGLAAAMVGKYFWTDANFSTTKNDFEIFDGGYQLFHNYTLDYNLTSKVTCFYEVSPLKKVRH